MKLAHISDLHFSKLSINPFQIFSKRIVGNINFLINRKNQHFNVLNFNLLDTLIAVKPDYVVISGDVSTTSFSKEFALARKFIQKLKEAHIGIIAIPGNHDSYTKRSYKQKHFYGFLGSVVDFDSDESISFNLEKDGVMAKKLSEDLWAVAIDTAYYSSVFLSTGLFNEKIERTLKTVLEELKDAKHVILINHFPFFQYERPSKIMYRAENLRALIRNYPNIGLYLHGHTHRQTIADLQQDNLPIILDAGSISLKKRSTWHLIDLQQNSCKVDSYALKENAWQEISSNSFTLGNRICP